MNIKELVNDYKNKLLLLEVINNGEYLFQKPTLDQIKQLEQKTYKTKLNVINMIQNHIDPYKNAITDDEYNRYIEIMFNAQMNDSVTLEESTELQHIENKIYNDILLTDQNSIMKFLGFMGVGFNKISETAIKGKVWAKWTMKFLKNGQISFNARNVTKRFNVTNGLELKKIFTGFEVI